MSILKRKVRVAELGITLLLTCTIASATTIASAVEQNKPVSNYTTSNITSELFATQSSKQNTAGIVILNPAGQEVDAEGNLIKKPEPTPPPAPAPVTEPAVASQPVPLLLPAVQGSTLIEAAESQLGQNQDCTALVERALRAIGVNIGDVGPMGFAGLGIQVSADDAQPGDILMRSGHVAIYLGNGMAIHGGYGGTTQEAPADPHEYAVIVRL